MPEDIPRTDLLIYGASGHAKVILDIAQRLPSYRVVGLLDDDTACHGHTLGGVSVLGGFELLERDKLCYCHLVLAIGQNKARKDLAKRVQVLGFECATLVQPSAQIGAEVAFGTGTVVMAGAVINADTVIGEHAIINTGAGVDHDCVIGDFVHIAPGVHLAGNVRVGELTHIGIGACVIQGIKIGEGAVIGAGAAVVEDVPAGVVVAGVPARVIRKLGEQ